MWTEACLPKASHLRTDMPVRVDINETFNSSLMIWYVLTVLLLSLGLYLLDRFASRKLF